MNGILVGSDDISQIVRNRVRSAAMTVTLRDQLPMATNGYQCARFKERRSAMTVNATLKTTREELSIAKQGIRNPQVVCLPAGEVIFRFASTRRQQTGEGIPSNQWARGAWWIREADYKMIIERFRKGCLSLGTVARSAAAVQPSWSAMDVSIKAHLLDDVNVYVGKGSTQYRDVLPNGMHVTLTGWSDIEQVYVPGMRRGGTTFSSIKVQRQKIISTESFGF